MVTFISGLSGPFLQTKQLNEYPPVIDYKVSEEVTELKVASGATRVYSKGFTAAFTLRWTKNNRCSVAQYNILQELCTRATVLRFVPYPDNYSSIVFQMRLSGGLDLSPVIISKEVLGFEGSILLTELEPQPEVKQFT